MQEVAGILRESAFSSVVDSHRSTRESAFSSVVDSHRSKLWEPTNIFLSSHANDHDVFIRRSNSRKVTMATHVSNDEPLTQDQHRTKGSCLEQWTPYKVFRFGPPKESSSDHQKLPLFQPCGVLKHASFVIPRSSDELSMEYKRFLIRLDRDGSYSATCMLVTLDLILTPPPADILEMEMDHEDGLDDEPTLADNTGDTWCLQEGWTLVQDKISWKSCCRLYARIMSRLQLVTLSHPLFIYVTHTLFQLNDEQFQDAMETCQSHGWVVLPPSFTNNRLQASQRLQNYVARQSVRVVGVLVTDPWKNNHPQVGVGSLTEMKRACLPNAILELQPCNQQDTTTALKCSLIALYDLDPKEQFTVARPEPPSSSCGCPKCSWDHSPSVSTDADKDAWMETMGTTQMDRLAHALFQEERLDQALGLYQASHDAYQARGDLAHAADIWHAMGAVELTRNRFLQAQRHWKKGGQYQAHEGIALQLAKQAAYRYLEPLPATTTTTTTTTAENPFPNSKSLGQKNQLFVTHQVVSPKTCQDLIQWAHDHANREGGGGWTTSRHYAVPTTDVPVHVVLPLLDWFQNWMTTDISPLLHQQFCPTTTNGRRRRFYVHDAFVVRYTATESSNFLPLHHDESTHSMILALNDDFEGGGTYIYDLDQTIIPQEGSLVTFAGSKVLHGGHVVTQGVRYILAVFLYLDQDCGMDADDKTETIKQQSFQETITESKRQKTSGFSFGFF
jgi:tetratricopeptide (TPR) repeat protein